MSSPETLHWHRFGDDGRTLVLDTRPQQHPPSLFCETALKLLAPECYGVALSGRRLNGDQVKEGHRFAVLDVDCETLGTGPTRAGAAEAAVLACIRTDRRLHSELESEHSALVNAIQVLRSV